MDKLYDLDFPHESEKNGIYHDEIWVMFFESIKHIVQMLHMFLRN